MNFALRFSLYRRFYRSRRRFRGSCAVVFRRSDRPARCRHPNRHVFIYQSTPWFRARVLATSPTHVESLFTTDGRVLVVAWCHRRRASTVLRRHLVSRPVFSSSFLLLRLRRVVFVVDRTSINASRVDHLSLARSKRSLQAQQQSTQYNTHVQCSSGRRANYVLHPVGSIRAVVSVFLSDLP